MVDEVSSVPDEWSRKSVSEFLSRLTPMVAAFEFSVDHLTKMVSVVEGEETITGAFLGAIMAHYPWCAVFGHDPSPSEYCGWANYSKSGHGEQSESGSGADFALVLRVGSRVRIAIFQAKKGHRVKTCKKCKGVPDEDIPTVPAVNVYRVRTEKVETVVEGKTETVLETYHYPQIDELIKTGIRLTGMSRIESQANAIETIKQDGLTWIHYLCYFKGDVVCVPLSGVSADVVEAARKSEAGADVYLTEENSISWVKVLRSGIEESKTDDWLDMTMEDAEQQLPLLLPLMSMVVVDDGTDGRAFRLAGHTPVSEKRVGRRGYAAQVSKEAVPEEIREIVASSEGGKPRVDLNAESVAERIAKGRMSSETGPESGDKGPGGTP